MGKSSFREINYSLRAAKAIERKMICEAIGRLLHLSQPAPYGYVGFGSTYFADFILFHRHLGLQRMISIESSTGSKDRFDFNKPFDCIEMQYGPSSVILPKLDIKQPCIYWLDYDGELTNSVCTDIEFLASRAKEMSVVIVTVNANPLRLAGQEDSATEQERVDQFVERLGNKYLPFEFEPKMLFDRKLRAKLGAKIMQARFEAAIVHRVGDPISFEQLFNFVYKDGACMHTFGGILWPTASERDELNANLRNLPYLRRTPEDLYSIASPNFTTKEIRYLNSFLPLNVDSEDLAFLPEKDRKEYAEVYRFFPHYSEVHL